MGFVFFLPSLMCFIAYVSSSDDFAESTRKTVLVIGSLLILVIVLLGVFLL